MTVDPRRAGLDPAHVLSVCTQAATAGGHPPPGYVVADSDGVTVAMTSKRAARDLHAALTQAGYDTELAGARRRWRLLVTSWNPHALDARLAALRATIQQLPTWETATVAEAIDHYDQHTTRGGSPGDAETLALRHVEHELRATVTARCGIRAPHYTAIEPADTATRLRLRTFWALEGTVEALLARQRRLARRAIAEYTGLRRYGSHDWAKDTVLRRRTAPPSAIGGLAGSTGPPGGGPPGWRTRNHTAHPGEASRGNTSTRAARHDLPAAGSAAIAESPPAGPAHDSPGSPPDRGPHMPSKHSRKR